MTFSLKTKFIIIGVIAVTAAAGAAYENHITDLENAHLAYEQQIATEVMQRHMNADMMHDGIRGNIYSALLAAKIGDAELLKASREDIRTMTEQFSKDVQENLKAQLPDDIVKQFAKIQAALVPYNQMALTISNAAEDFEAAHAILPQFAQTFDALEEQQGKASDMVMSWIKNARLHAAETAEQAELLMMIVEGLSILISILVPVFAMVWIFRPQAQMIDAMNQIAEGNTDTEIPHVDRKDEIGEMARTVQVFKDNALKITEMSKQQEIQQRAVETQRRASLHAMAAELEQKVKHVVDMVASAATEMDSTSKSVAQMADGSQQKLQNLAEQISSASHNVQTVAGASSQLSSAINSISAQVSRSSDLTHSAVDDAAQADTTAAGLSEAAQKISEVVEMINSIAAQINLLALNATIEAARAGEAGKGFAVVASEVKNLASQTTKATEQIGALIGAIQGATSDTVGVIKNISSKIRNLNEISTTIAAAVEQQGAATQDISSNVQQAATSTEEVSRNASDVTRTAQETGAAAGEMTAASSELSRQAEVLRREIDTFLTNVRAA